MATEDGIRKTETDYNPENSITKSLTAKELISNDIGTATNATDMPNRWSSIDFYGATVTTADDFSKSLNNMYADLQHYAFNMYTERNHIINTSMIL
ncbi:hypothetical protein FACS189459_0210 [Bacilli bacterium]|nr:hypothetical protein FACS189459_0210 [Bacilli bacterium]GHU53805.1 hypothetical protein FACS189496_5320 [Bacilli bacterium]